MGILEERYPKLAESYKGISVKPDKICLNYPVISFLEEDHEPSFQALTGGNETLRNKLSVEQHIDITYPKTFVWACEDDALVPASNAKRMGEALKRAGVPISCRRSWLQAWRRNFRKGLGGCDDGVYEEIMRVRL